MHDLSFAGRERRGLLDVVLDDDGQRLHIFATHLGLARRERRRQIDQLFSRLAVRQEPSLQRGDFKAWRGGMEMRLITALGFEHLPVRSFPTPPLELTTP